MKRLLRYVAERPFAAETSGDAAYLKLEKSEHARANLDETNPRLKFISMALTSAR